MEKIIDLHAHLGDCFYPGGGRLIDQKGVKPRYMFDIIGIAEKFYKNTVIKSGKIGYLLNKPLIASALRKRNRTATLENWRQSIDQAGIWRSVCAACEPFTSFADIQAALKKEDRIIPFTGVDFEHEERFEEKLVQDVERGARGLKLHPILQRIRLNSEKVYHVIEAFAPHEFPVNFHCGVVSIYAKSDALRKTERPEYGSVSDAAEMVRAFPNVKFLATHAGIFEFSKFIELFGKFKNVWVDGTAQPTSHIRKLIKIFGPDRVVFASDWPYGDRSVMLKLTKNACDGDPFLERKVLCENAMELLRL
jgi:predicted TIM-barrel fold metal-dependent hydrolase